MTKRQGQDNIVPFPRQRETGFAVRRQKPRWPLLLAIVLFHILAIIGLARAFAPDFTSAVIDKAESLVTVTVTAPEEPEPAPPPDAPAKPDAGAEGEAGKKAIAKEVVAKPNPKQNMPAPRASSTGTATASGGSDAGEGTGAGNQGEGTGSGSSGSGQGSGIATKPQHIGGQIDNARDYPVPPGGREARIGKSVIIALTVEPDGRASACSVYRSSGFPDTDATTCRLAMERLRFRPATNQRGEAITATFYWQQRFFF